MNRSFIYLVSETKHRPSLKKSCRRQFELLESRPRLTRWSCCAVDEWRQT